MLDVSAEGALVSFYFPDHFLSASQTSKERPKHTVSYRFDYGGGTFLEPDESSVKSQTLKPHPEFSAGG